MVAGDWSPTTTRPVCRINRDSLSLKGPLNDLQEWRAPRDANSRLYGQGNLILRSFQLRSCRKWAITTTTIPDRRSMSEIGIFRQLTLPKTQFCVFQCGFANKKSHITMRKPLLIPMAFL